MSALCSVASIPDDNSVGNFSVVAARLVEAACLARDGNCEAARAHIERAMALLRGEPSRIPSSPRHANDCARAIMCGGLATWQQRRLVTYVDAHLSESIRVADLAALLDLSESHFSRAFRRSFGTSAHEYVTRRRIEVAQSLMLESREPLCAIALQAGLCDQTHFTRVFRRIVGQTPYVWRRARWGEFEVHPTEGSGSSKDPRRLFAVPNRAETDC